jgi:ribonuclease T2
VHLGCDRSNSLQEVWYFFHLQGSVATGTFIPTDSITSSTCRDGFRWRPKSPGGGGGGGGGGDPRTSGQIKVAGQKGCLISTGKWYTSGTCAKFRLTENIGGVHLSSSKGPCGISDGDLVCSSWVTASDFTMDSDGYLSYGGSSEWHVDDVPFGFKQETVSPGSGAVTIQLRFAENSRFIS